MSKKLHPIGTIPYIELHLKKYRLGLSKWAPGDGWTRYRVVDYSSGGEREISDSMKLVELKAWFKGFMIAKTGEKW